MTDEMKPGSRWRSVTCDTQVVVVRAPSEAVELRCGGAPMVAADDDTATDASLDPEFGEGTLLGKRYTDADTALEVLCVTPGAGSLSADDRRLTRKEAKPLPSSD